MPKPVESIYGNRVRARACGICVVGDRLLMINHVGLTDSGFWAPPGGGIEMDETAPQTLQREFLEETHLTIKVKDMLFVAELSHNPLHAVELFFEVEWVGGDLITGSDPEMKPEDQIITEARFLSWNEIKKLDGNHVHGIFKYTSEPNEILDLRGYFKL